MKEKAAELFLLQSKENDGRGVLATLKSCAKTFRSFAMCEKHLHSS